MAYQDFYQVLGVESAASQEEIQTAFRKLARKFHPDVSKEDDAEERFKEIGSAYEVLNSPEKRALYDQYGEHWKAISEGRRPPPGAENAQADFGRDVPVDPEDLQDLFEQMFAGRYRQRAHRDRRGHDIEAHIELGIEEAFRGGQHEIALSDPRDGTVRSYKVNIPPGVRPDQRIRLSGQGGKGSGGEDGDLYLRILLRPDDRFRLDGNDIRSLIHVPYWTAALGGDVTLPTIDGNVRVKVPAGSSSGQKIRLKGKGYGTQGHRGNMVAEVQITVPNELSPEERTHLEAIMDLKTGEES